MSGKYDVTGGDKRNGIRNMSTTGVHKVFQNTRIRVTILGDRILTSSMFQNEGPLLLGAAVRNLVVRPNWRPKLIHPWPKGGIWYQRHRTFQCEV
jgi:hypothetical protein